MIAQLPAKTTTQTTPAASGSCAALYGSTLDKVLQYGVGKGYYPQSDIAAIKNRINQMATKYQFSPDDFGVFTLIESDGMDPKANNRPGGIGCVGIIQWCQPEETVNTSPEAILRMSTLQQLDLVDVYFQQAPLRKGADQVTLYLSVLYPTAQSISGPNESLLPSYETSQQAKILLGSSGTITRTSINSALTSLAKSKLACAPTPGSGSPGLLAGGSGPVQAGAIGTNSAILSGENCPPPPFNQRDRIVYVGCKTKIASASRGGSGFGYASNGVAYQGTPTSSTNGLTPYTGPLRPGAFILPLKGAVVTSSFGMRESPTGKGYRLHSGIDFGAPEGTTVYAAADGVVIEPTGLNIDPNGYGTYATIQHSGAETLYAHLSQLKVKVGQTVKQGEIIGAVGGGGSFGSGGSTGAHLHFEIAPGGKPTDPAQFYSQNLSRLAKI